MKRQLFALIVLCSFFPEVYAQKPPAKFGQVSFEEIASTAYETDSSMEAAILFHFGSFDETDFRFINHIRYKIYTKEGLKRLILKIPSESKSSIRGYVFNIEDGKVVKEKIDKKSIYRDRVEGKYSMMRLAPPNAKEGSVIEIQYVTNGLPNIWKFQSDIPVLWSEINIPDTEYITFNKRFVGYEPLKIASHTRWVAENMPAFRPEPYIDTRNNYMKTMYIDVSEVHFPGSSYSAGYYKSYSNSWEDVCKHFWEDVGYNIRIRNGNAFLNDAAKEIEATAESDLEKLKLALENIRETVTWNNDIRMMPTDFLRDVYLNEKTGSSADMNFLFIKLCRLLDLECYPAILGTRNSGLINPYFPCTSGFNYVMSYVSIGEDEYFIDASAKHFPLGMLPKRCINQRAFVLNPSGARWIDVVPNGSSDKMIYCTMNLSEDGLMNGSIVIRHSGYSAVLMRKELETYNSDDEYLEKFEQKNKGIMVLDYEVKNRERKYEKLTESFEVETNGGAISAGDLIYLNTVLLGQIEENPFKIEKREYPVDFTTGMNLNYILNLTLPEGYSVEQLPEPISISTADKSACFLFQSMLQSNTLQVVAKINIKKPIFLQDEYEELKSLYNIIVNKEQEPVIVKKIQN